MTLLPPEVQDEPMGLADNMDHRALDASAYDTDKAAHPHYLRSYEEYFRPLLDKEIRLLELGVYKGGSLLLWRDYFERGSIIGLDLQPVTLDDPTGRIRVYQGMQQDTTLLDRIGSETAPGGFDVIIDDCSHIGELTRISFWHLFDNHLKRGGLYVIEDWSASYWDSWFDGAGFRYAPKLNFDRRLFRIRSAISHAQRSMPALNPLLRTAKRLLNRNQFHSHNYGLVGFVKSWSTNAAWQISRAKTEARRLIDRRSSKR